VVPPIRTLRARGSARCFKNRRHGSPSPGRVPLGIHTLQRAGGEREQGNSKVTPLAPCESKPPAHVRGRLLALVR